MVSNKKRAYLLPVAFLIDMGETFFCPNNMSILCYMLIAMYAFIVQDSAGVWERERENGNDED